MLINNNVLQFCGTFLSENLSVYLMFIISLGRCDSFCDVFFSTFFFLNTNSALIQSPHILSSTEFAWYIVQIKRGSHSAVVLREPEWALITILLAFGEGATGVIGKHAKAFHRLLGGKDHAFTFFYFSHHRYNQSHRELQIYTFYRIME